jgi:hypothetical protein
VAEAAELLGISRSNAYVHWDYARAWLRREIAGEKESRSDDMR